MRKLIKKAVNVAGAKLYATECWREGTKVFIGASYEPIRDDCMVNATYVDHRPKKGMEIKNIDVYLNSAKREMSEKGICSFAFYIHDTYYGRYTTSYHEDGKCREK